MPPKDERLLAGRYRLVDEVGRGALGTVHKALDTSDGSTVAIKLLHSEGPRDGSVLDRLIYEVELVRKVKHPNICQLLCLNSHEGKPFVAMEILRGPDLSAYLSSRGGRLGLDETVALLRGVAEALDQAHKAHVVHLDLKPTNLQFSTRPEEGGVLKILDFGLARSVGSVRGTGAKALGSPAYRCPEQARGGDPRPAWDVYALAATAYELLAGMPPFLGDDLERRKLEEPVKDIQGQPKAVSAVLRRALSPRPEERPAKAGELIAALKAAGRSWTLLWILAVVLVLGGLLVLAHLTRT